MSQCAFEYLELCNHYAIYYQNTLILHKETTSFLIVTPHSLFLFLIPNKP